MSNRGGKKSRKQKLLLVLLGIGCGLLLTEVFLRVAGYSAPLFYGPDYERGIALRPNIAGTYQREGRNNVSINSAGLRDREHPLAKPPGTIRIALLGDSYCEALQVPMAQTFWWLLQQKLEGCEPYAGKQIEIINFGASGYGTAQELITLRQRVWQYSPDIVMLLVTTNNDISDNVRLLKKTDQIPYFVYQNNQLVEDDSFRNSAYFKWRKFSAVGTWFRDHLRLVQLGYEAQLLIKTKLDERRARQQLAPAAGPARAPADKPSRPDVSVENMIYLEPHEAVWNDAWTITEALIKQIDLEVKDKGAKFLLVVGSNPIQVHPDASVRQRFRNYLDVDTLFYPNQRLAQLAGREQIDFLDLAAPLEKSADETKVFYHGFGKEIGNGHWNADGHRLAAELIAQKMCSQPSPSR
ncbi:MAG TPA: SGNH/GDSL hydrolase family protein [Pyrinomonadaceae bacterium]|nr:SGNH/GDSL hydrolase family protein [Pyrinomonadaceae bacterium]